MKKNNITSLVRSLACTLSCAANSEQQASTWALWLVQKTTSKSSAQLLTEGVILLPAQRKQLTQWVNQITRLHKPIEYILEKISFANLELYVSPPTLIPRIETEYWVVQLAELLLEKGQTFQTILDIGTGSGCIALTLAQMTSARVIATDISQQALKLTQKNALHNGLHTISYIYSDLYTSLDPSLLFDCIISNPPYIPTTMHSKLPPSVKQWEDDAALFSGSNGLDHITAIIKQAAMFLHCPCTYKSPPVAQLCLEVDISHIESVVRLLQENQFTSIRRITDQFSRERAIFATKKCPH